MSDNTQQQRQRRDTAGHHCRHPRGRGKYSNYLLSGLITCGDCNHKFQGYTHKARPTKKNPNPVRPLYYLCGGYITKGNSVCRRVAYPRNPLEGYILSRIQARLQVFLREGGDQILRQFIADEFSRSADPREELAGVQAELATLKKDADRLLDNLTAANRDFVDERLLAIRRRMRELEARQQDVEAVVSGTLDGEAATTQALARLAKIREVLDQGTIVEQKEFLRGLVAGITLYPGEHRGVVTFYDLIPASFKCHGGTGDELEKMQVWPGKEQMRWAMGEWREAA